MSSLNSYRLRTLVDTGELRAIAPQCAVDVE